MFELGKAHLEDGHHLRALSNFLAAMMLSPSKHEYQLAAANMHLKLGEVDSANALYGKLSASALPEALVAEHARQSAKARATEVRNWRVGPLGWERIQEVPPTPANSVGEAASPRFTENSSSNSPRISRLAIPPKQPAAGTSEQQLPPPPPPPLTPPTPPTPPKSGLSARVASRLASPRATPAALSPRAALDTGVQQDTTPKKHSILMSVGDLGEAIEEEERASAAMAAAPKRPASTAARKSTRPSTRVSAWGQDDLSSRTTEGDDPSVREEEDEDEDEEVVAAPAARAEQRPGPGWGALTKQIDRDAR